jgi:hypothetical protein
MPSGKIVSVQGYEPLFLDLILEEYEEDDITVAPTEVPKVMYWSHTDQKEKRYFMDAYVYSKDAGVEVKSLWTYKYACDMNISKWIEASHVCSGGLEVFIFDGKNLIGRHKIVKGETTLIDYDGFKMKEEDFFTI